MVAQGIQLLGRVNGAGEGNRTLVFSLEDYGSTIELHPQLEDPVGLEPTALGLKVPCTTYCATDP